MRVIGLMSNATFHEARHMIDRAEMRNCMNDALWFAIETKREIIAFDLIQFSNERAFALSFEEKQM